MRGIDLHIRIFGWHLALVEAEHPWYYTVGLRETYSHPELVVVNLKSAAAQELIPWAVAQIEALGRLDPEELRDAGVETVPVHDRHLTGDWFGMWANHYGKLPESGSFIQLIPPSSWFCSCHRDTTPRLDRPDGKPSANRAARRAKDRRGMR